MVKMVPLALLAQAATRYVSTTAITASLATQVALVLRGGVVDTVLNMDRTKLRLDGLSQYAVVSGLLMNACLRLFSATPKNLEVCNPSDDLEKRRTQRGVNAAKVVFCMANGLSIIAGAYTTVVFSLLGLYSKTALGMGHDQEFLKFFEATLFYRQAAFDAFVLSLVSFELSFLSSLYINYKGKMRYLITGLALCFLLASFYHWATIMAIAGKLLFAAPGSGRVSRL